MIIVQLATIPSRRAILPRVLKSLINQVDRILLAVAVAVPQGEPDSIEIGDITSDEARRIHVTFHDNSLQDAARWINAPTDPGHYVLVCDDDIEYPSNYVQEMMGYMKSPFNNRVILSCMGKKLKPRPIQSFFKDEVLCLKTFEKVSAFYSVEIPGACAMIYHTDRIVITPDDIESPNSDICTGVIAKRKGVQCFVVPHSADWLTNLMPLLPPDTYNMFDQYKVDDSALTRYVNENL